MGKHDKSSKNKILTVPNVITIFRIILIPVFVVLLLQKQNIFAFLIFIIACISDGIDGFIARQFNQESRLGAILDPIADRGLLICGSITLCVLGRLPLWILILVIARDLTFLLGGGYLLKKYNIRIKVIWLGKIATTCFYIGFAMLVLIWPFGFGIGLFDVSWLPGFGSDIHLLGIWPVYLGILLNVFTTTYYIKEAFVKYNEVKNANR